ncbi:MAG: hypothetical protein H2060_09795 [Azoarcus sp.]|nr:hypothetical protein [Azoarcus sp.]
MTNSRSLRFALRFLLVTMLVFAPVAATFATTLTVNSTGDTNARDSVLTLREAVLYTNGTLNFASFDVTEQAQIDESTSLIRDTIEFNIAGGGTAQTINFGSSLPQISVPVFIDGTTQLGAAATTPGIVINGGNAISTAFEIGGAGGGSEIRGLVIGGFTDRAIFLNITVGNVIAGNHLGVDLAGTASFANGDGSVTDAGVRVNGGNNNTIGGITAADRNIISGNNQTGIFITSSGQGVRVIGNFIGTDVTGTVALPNLGEGMRIDASPTNNTVGGTTPGERNIISGNTTDGIIVRGDDNIITGNYIGTDVTGSVALPNGTNGLHFGERTSDGNTVGGVNATPGVLNVGNLISGNTMAGIKVQGASSAQPPNVIRGNFIGTNAAGTSAIPNAVGISVEDDPDDSIQSGTLNTIGGVNTTPGSLDAGNLISGNTGPGVRLGPLTRANTLHGNFIGTQIDGTSALANGTAGIELQTSSDQNTIGSVAPGGGNLIAFNSGPGVLLTGAGTERNDIVGNSIHSNSGLGIDLGGDGVTPNDAGDVDTNPNQLQNFPVLISGGTAVVGSLDSMANMDYRIDAYANTATDASGNGEGEVYLGSGMVTTDGAGHVDFDLPVASNLIPGKLWISVTATDENGNTSEFSVPADCSEVPAPTFTITSQTDDTATAVAKDFCEGLVSVVLEGGSSNNVSFNLVSGTPNQSHWNFEVTLDDIFAPGTAVLTATDGNGSAVQQTINLTGTCNPALPPVINITAQTASTISGTVQDDCNGLQSLVLGPDSENAILTITSGVPGDSMWTFEITLDDPDAPGSAQLIANDSAAVSVEQTVSFADAVIVGIPVLGPLSLALMGILLAGLGMRQRAFAGVSGSKRK